MSDAQLVEADALLERGDLDDALLAPFATRKQRPRKLTLVTREDDAATELVRTSPLFRDVEDLTVSLPPPLVPQMTLPALRVLRFFWGVPEGVTAFMPSPLARHLEALEFRRGQHGFEPKLRARDGDGLFLHQVDE